jgi:hypothetical protein
MFMPRASSLTVVGAQRIQSDPQDGQPVRL